MVYAPVIIPTLCRSEHFIRCIESLRKNTWADKTDIYIGLDYPCKDEHWAGYNRIKRYLEGQFSEFHSVRVFIRDKNYGPERNARALRRVCSQEYDRYIYIEDDLELSPNFLVYMDTALDAYENDNTVVGVTGYAYPLPWIADPGCTVVKQNFNASMWGTGVWVKKRKRLMNYLRCNGLSRSFSSAYKSGKLNQMTDYAVKDYVTLVRNGWSSPRGFLNRSTDISVRIYLAVQQQYYVMPLISKVRNYGYDGTGYYCPKNEVNSDDRCINNYDFSKQIVDTSESFSLIEDTRFPMELNRQLLNSFDAVPKVTMNQIWEEAKTIAARGRFYGLFRRLGSVIHR